MKYRVTIEGETREVDVHVTPEGNVSVAVDGQQRDADVVRVPGGISLRLGARVFDIAVGGKPEDRNVAAGVRRTVAQVESERQRARNRRKGGASGPSDKEMRAPMPGRIVRVMVKAGDEVEANAPVVVMEAMKMENELRSTGPGKVATVHVNEGQNVEGNALLVTFE